MYNIYTVHTEANTVVQLTSSESCYITQTQLITSPLI